MKEVFEVNFETKERMAPESKINKLMKIFFTNCRQRFKRKPFLQIRSFGR